MLTCSVQSFQEDPKIRAILYNVNTSCEGPLGTSDDRTMGNNLLCWPSALQATRKGKKGFPGGSTVTPNYCDKQKRKSRQCTVICMQI